jgi:hypothetical protein
MFFAGVEARFVVVQASLEGRVGIHCGFGGEGGRAGGYGELIPRRDIEEYWLMDVNGNGNVKSAVSFRDDHA